MKKVDKKNISEKKSPILVLCMIFILLMSSGMIYIVGINEVVAEEDYSSITGWSGDFFYSVFNNRTEVSITMYRGDGGHVVIPSIIGVDINGIIEWIPVSTIYGAFYRCTSITSVTIPDSVMTIADGTFAGCSSLTSVTIPAGVAMGNSVFAGCTALSNLTISDGVTSIENATFDNCISLTSVTIPNSVTSIRECAFASCSSLTSITVENSVTTIGENAFAGCSSLTNLTIPSNIQNLKEWAFYECNAIACLTITNGATYIANHTFTRFANLTSVSIPNSVTSIGEYAFSYCTSLTSVSIPGSVTSIGEYAFYQCTSLTSVVISNSISSIEAGMFCECSSLASVIIPSGISSIGGLAFWDCQSLSSMTIPDSVVSIGWQAIANCKGLTQMYFYGNAPTCDYQWIWLHNDNLIIYFICGKTGFTTPTWYGVKTVCQSDLSVPSVPQNFDATPSDGQVSLSWAAPGSEGGAPIDYYIIYQDGAYIREVNGFSTTITGLINGQKYSFAVAAHNVIGEGAAAWVKVTPPGTIDYLTNWNPLMDSYAFENYGSVWTRGNCYGMSATALLYYLRYQSGGGGEMFPSFPSQPDGASSTSDLKIGSSDHAKVVLNNVSLSILLHQLHANSGLPWSNDQDSAFQQLKASIQAGQPALMNLGYYNAHTVIAYGLTQYANGTYRISISDPNIPYNPNFPDKFIRYAWFYSDGDDNHIKGAFQYQGDIFYDSANNYGFNIESPPSQLSRSWWTISHWWPWLHTFDESIFGYHFVIANEQVKVIEDYGNGQSLPDYFILPSDSQTFQQGIRYSAGIEENGMQAYAIFGTTNQLKIVDPAPGSSMIVDFWVTNDTGNIAGYGFMLNITSTKTHDCNITDNPNGIELNVGHQSVKADLTLFSWNEEGFYQLNATKLSFKAGDVVNLTIADWTALNSTTNSVVTVVVTPQEGSPTSFQLLNNQTGLDPGSDDSTGGPLPTFVTYLMIGVIVVVAVAIVVVVIQKRRGTNKP
jgi:hypothetical protein